MENPGSGSYRIQIRQKQDLDPVYPDLDPDLPDLDPAKPDADPVSAGAGYGSCRIQGSPWTLQSGSGSTYKVKHIPFIQ